MKIVLITWLLLWSTPLLMAQSDAVRAAWTQAKDLCNEQEYIKAKPFLLAVYEEMPRPLCCYWLALAYDIETERDSAIFYYKASIQNSNNKPQLAAWDNLIRAQLRQLDFKTAYATAWKALQKYPGNKALIEEFGEVCKWSYFINHLKFEKSYLSSTELQQEYSVKTITEQELIVKNIRNKEGQFLHVSNRQYKGIYELWKCHYNGSKTLVEIKFNLADHDIDRKLEQQAATAKSAYNNTENPMELRIGALLTLLPLSDNQMLDLLASDQEAIRFCTCTAVKSTTSKKVKKSCLSDSSELIKSTCSQLDAFK
jgi:tetratricopeptide (TPR) repeat protein